MSTNLVSSAYDGTGLSTIASQIEAQDGFASNFIYCPFKIHNSLCALDYNAGSIFQLLKSLYPQGGTVNWLKIKAEPVADSDVEMYAKQHPDYTGHPSNNAKIAGFKEMLDQKREQCEEGARRAYNLFNRLGDLHIGATALIENDSEADSVLKEVSEADLTSVCLFALSIPSTASCYPKIKGQIEQKLRKNNLEYKTDDLWSLCRELEPRMQRDTFATIIGQLAYIINLDDNTHKILTQCIDAKQTKQLTLDQAIDQYPFHKSKLDAPGLKHALHLVAKLADWDPDTDKGHVVHYRKQSFFLVFALALSEVGREGKYYQKWCDLLKTAITP